MSIAQQIYEGIDMGEGPVGLITYMRTDSLTVARDAVEACRDFVVKRFGDKYCPEKPNLYKSRGTAQEAHEAIRPTDVCRTPETLENRLDPSQVKIYRLIWNRFVASQMSPAKIEQRTVEVEASPQQDKKRAYIFRATSSEVKFPGYMRVSGVDSKAKNTDGDEVERLPDLSKGEPLECLEWLGERKETKPPRRYSEASLISTLEKNGVGRPSTYAQTVATLYQRNYVTREKKSLVPTEVGKEVSSLLVATLGELFNVTFTATMEDSLDQIEKGSLGWTEMLEEFYGQFQAWMGEIKVPVADPGEVAEVLGALEPVKQWAPEVKKGKRVYNDEQFVESIRNEMEKGTKKITERQFDTLAKIACRYRSQAPGIIAVLERIGRGDLLGKPELQPPREATRRKLKLLQDVPLDDSGRSFVDSLGARVDNGRSLTEAQIHVLNTIVLNHAGKIEGFDRLRSELDLAGETVVEDKESARLIAALASVSKWGAPVARKSGKVFDDQAFYASVSQYFATRSFLSARQKSALRRMIEKYRDQVADYGRVVEECGLRKGKPRRAKGGTTDTPRS